VSNPQMIHDVLVNCHQDLVAVEAALRLVHNALAQDGPKNEIDWKACAGAIHLACFAVAEVHISVGRSSLHVLAMADE